MLSILNKRMTLIFFSVALVVAGTLDIVSTFYAALQTGGWLGENNPIFRALGGNEMGNGAALVVIILIKAVISSFSIIWIAKVMGRIPDLYPQSGGKYGFVRFANNMFYGKDVLWWTVLFGIPPLKRMSISLSIPIATAIVVSGIIATITNTFSLLSCFSAVVILTIISAGVGGLLGIELLRRDFLQIKMGNRW